MIEQTPRKPEGSPGAESRGNEPGSTAKVALYEYPLSIHKKLAGVQRAAALWGPPTRGI
ncbi:hypothetical protein [Paenibacillus zeisoli]|uniref:hypothetical protein n=1 Tax=Paenibacillus zeisoli TaxID=2496267 RepID=UPI00163C3D0B|nr:hypothetical protein [Paenibacillus zeisoli]